MGELELGADWLWQLANVPFLGQNLLPATASMQIYQARRDI